MCIKGNKNLEVLDEIKRVWADGMSASDVAAALGNKISRNSIIGYFQRHREYLLPCRLRTAPEVKRSQRETAKVRIQNGSTLVTPIKPRTNVQKVSPTTLSKLMDEPTVKPLPSIAPPCSTNNVKLVDLEPHHCRWVHGEKDFLFCGEPKVPGKSWCMYHCKIGYSLITYRATRDRYERIKK